MERKTFTGKIEMEKISERNAESWGRLIVVYIYACYLSCKSQINLSKFSPLFLAMKNVFGLMPHSLFFYLLFIFSYPQALCSFSLSNSSSTVKHLCSLKDGLALLHFRNSFKKSLSSNSQVIESWKENSDCCFWDGVTCDRLTGHVIGLKLANAGLSGTINENSTFFSLHHLRKLNLACNDFRESKISSRFGGFSKLKYLNLSSSYFFGLVPFEISHLSKLISLDLSSNYDLTLNQHSFDELLKNATELSHLVLDSVNMSSVSISSFGNMPSSLKLLSLDACSLQGRLPNDVFRLPLLQQLRLCNNPNLNGYLPNSTWSTSFRGLDLSNSAFSGNIPDAIGSLRYLNELYLYNHFIDRGQTQLRPGRNKFSGQLPNVFNKLRKITHLDISGNKFSGELPSSVFNLTELSDLELSHNAFSGFLPSHVSGLQNLRELDLSNNKLSGSLPPWLFALPSLFGLDIGFNNFIGPFEQIQPNASSLYYIDLSHNEIHGPVPDFLFELVNLTHLDLSSNYLSGSINPDKFAKPRNFQDVYLSNNNGFSFTDITNVTFGLPNLNTFDCSSCNLTEIPRFLRAAKNLTDMDLSKNRIAGHISLAETESWQSLVWLDLSRNLLRGVEINSSLKLWKLDLHANMLEGPFIVPPPNLKFFSVSQNKFTGEIPSSLCNHSSIKVMDFSNNSLSGKIPQCLGNLDNLFVLNLGMNNFSGNIPLSENNFFLSYLNLNGNHLEGPLPPSLVNCRKLEVLDVGNNMIHDIFPHWLEELPELRILIMSSNRFYGSIDSFQTTSPFPKLQIVDISHNEFTGLLPITLFKNVNATVFTYNYYEGVEYMSTYVEGYGVYVDSVSLTIKGNNIWLEKILAMLGTLDLSSNQFQGPIPAIVGNLNSLKGLNFSYNNLIGPIPSSFRNLAALESLDLSSNNLTGRIPTELAGLTSLSTLNLSYNRLIGPIPQGSQLRTFGNSCYVGNLDLCGFPLSKECDDGKPGHVPSIDNKDEDDNTWEWFWKIVMMGYGSGLVIGVSLSYMVFSTRRPFCIVKMYEKLRQRWEKPRRPRERRRGGRRN